MIAWVILGLVSLCFIQHGEVINREKAIRDLINGKKVTELTLPKKHFAPWVKLSYNKELNRGLK